MKKDIGYVAVDSGTLMIVDPCYVLDGGKYKKVMKMDLDKKNTLVVSGVGGTATVFRTAFGDGVYPVVAHYHKDGTLKSVEVLLS